MDHAFLSVRLPPEVRNRVKAAAATRGQTVQELIGGLVERFLAEQDRRPLTLAGVLTTLRARAPELRQRGIARLWVFGSLARGEARVDSDIDLVAEFAPEAKLSLTGFASLRADLSEMLSAPVDLAEWHILRPPVRAQAERDAVQVF
jgi:predicted nucleotidyltransferase